MLRVTVISTDTARYQPVVTVLDPANNEVACGVLAVGKAGAQANATAYVTPGADGAPATYLVRVAQVAQQLPTAGLPMLTVRFAGRDVTPPHIVVGSPGQGAARRRRSPTAPTNSSTMRSQIDPLTAHWEFHDADQRQDVVKRTRWPARDLHVAARRARTPVDFRVKDRAGNESMYRFTTFVLDTMRAGRHVQPATSGAGRPPAAGRRQGLRVGAPAPARHQAGRNGPCCGAPSTSGATPRTRARSRCTGGVGQGLLVISGIARDLAGNATPLRSAWSTR